MKDKKLLVVLFLTFCMGFLFCNKAVLAAEMETYKINNTTLSFNKIVYIDINKGSDTTGNGTATNPFANIRKAMDYLCDNGYKENVAIVMNDGDYDWSPIAVGESYTMDNKYNKMKVNFISKNPGKVYIHSSKGFEFGIVQNDSNSRIKVTFYGIIFHDLTFEIMHLAMEDWGNEYYNCVFDGIKSFGGWNGMVATATAKVVNCLFNNCTAHSVYTDYPIAGSEINSASTNTFFEPLKGTVTTSFTNVTVDEKYNITSPGWKNAGTGKNPDGSVANIGVYGGEFAWNYVGPKLKLLLEVKEEKQLSVSEDLYDNANMIWTSSDTSIATIDANGKIKALKPGNTVITCTNEDGSYSEKINVLVVDLTYQLAVDLKVGEKAKLTVDGLTNAAKVIWTANDTTISTVSSKGRVTAVSEGLTYVTATDENGKEIGRIYIRVTK